MKCEARGTHSPSAIRKARDTNVSTKKREARVHIPTATRGGHHLTRREAHELGKHEVHILNRREAHPTLHKREGHSALLKCKGHNLVNQREPRVYVDRNELCV